MLFVLRCFEAKSLDKTSFSGVGFQGKVVDLVLSNNFPWEPMSEDEVLSRVLVDLCHEPVEEWCVRSIMGRYS